MAAILRRSIREGLWIGFWGFVGYFLPALGEEKCYLHRTRRQYWLGRLYVEKFNV
jgi:hypothetical protein